MTTTKGTDASSTTSNPGERFNPARHVFIEQATRDDVADIRMMGLRFLATNPFGGTAPADPARLDQAIGLCLGTGVILIAKVPLRPDQEGEWRAAGMFCAYAMPHPFTGEQMAEELAWWVEPEYRSGRVGRKLLCDAMVWARQAGVGCLRMNAPAGSNVGLVLQRHGFVPVETAHVLRFT